MSEMVPFRLLVSREEALKTVLDSVKQIERTEQIRIDESTGRVLAEDVTADKDVPPFDRAAMDGYALRAVDTYGASDLNARSLKLTAALHAGESTTASVSKGECIRIATGCQVPPNSDAVVMVEFTEEKDDQVLVLRPVHPGANISRRGEDMKKGEAILRREEVLTPAKIGVLAALGRKNVLVYQKPLVAAIPTGTEIAEVGSNLEEGQVYDVNSYTLASLLLANGAIITKSPIVPDSLERLK